jgi:outer membrane protein TolC
MLARAVTTVRVVARLALLSGLVAGPALHAQQPSEDLSMLLAEAAVSNPRIRAADRSADAARARVLQAGALPDPMLGLGFMNVPATRPGLAGDMMTMTRLELQETFPWPGKLSLQSEVADLRAEAAAWEAQRVREEVAAEVKGAYFEVYFLDRALDVTRRNAALLQGTARLASVQYGVGAGTQPDVLRAQVEGTRLADQAVELAERRTSIAARLNALLGRPSGAAFGPVEIPAVLLAAAEVERIGGPSFASATLSTLAGSGGDDDPIPSAEELQALALETNPMIRAHVNRVAAQERATTLAGKAVLPDFHVSVAYSRRADLGDFVDVMVSAPLPIFRGRRQDQAVLEEEALLAEDEALHHAMVNDLNAEIESLVAALRRTRAQMVLLSDGILPQASASLEAATASYRVGRVDFLTLLDAQVTLYQHELDYHRLLADFASDVAELERAVGTEVLR